MFAAIRRLVTSVAASEHLQQLEWKFLTLHMFADTYIHAHIVNIILSQYHHTFNTYLSPIRERVVPPLLLAMVALSLPDMSFPLKFFRAVPASTMDQPNAYKTYILNIVIASGKFVHTVLDACPSIRR